MLQSWYFQKQRQSYTGQQQKLKPATKSWFDLAERREMSATILTNTFKNFKKYLQQLLEILAPTFRIPCNNF